MEKDNAKTDDLIKVVVIGPESTGKSMLSSSLATYYRTEWVPEYARHYIDRLDRSYEEHDLLAIAKGQLAWEKEKERSADHLLICDTDLIVIKVWSEHKYGVCDNFILDTIKEREYDLYLLTDVDLPWVDDPQRENPNLGSYFLDIFKREIEATGVPYAMVSGDHYQRKRMAVKAIDELLSNTILTNNS